MINRRAFTALLAGTVAAPNRAWSQHVTAKTVFYASTGPELALFDVDVGDAALQKRSTVTLPANVQYAWPHPSKRYLYVVSSSGGPGVGGTTHLASAFRIDPLSGALAPHGEPQSLPSRPIHTSVDRSGEYLLTAYNAPSNVTVHRISGDGSIGKPISQPDKLDAGIYGHQIRTTPGNQTAILVARGNNAAGDKPEDPGALKLFGFKRGALTNLASIAPGTGLGFGPRHLDFHPSQPWVYVSIERQNKLYTYKKPTIWPRLLIPMAWVSRTPEKGTSMVVKLKPAAFVAGACATVLGTSIVVPRARAIVKSAACLFMLSPPDSGFPE